MSNRKFYKNLLKKKNETLHNGKKNIKKDKFTKYMYKMR